MPIPIPPAPSWLDEKSAVIFGILAACGIAGVILVFWGRIAGRIVLALAGAALGGWFGGPLAVRFGFGEIVGQAGGAALAGVATFLLSRTLWTLFIVIAFESAAIIVTVLYYLPPPARTAHPASQPAASEFAAWAEQTAKFFIEGFRQVVSDQMTTVLMIVVVAGLLPLLIAIFRKKIALVFITSLIGAISLVGSLWLLLAQWRGEIWARQWPDMLVPAGAAAVITLVGWVVQGVAAVAEAKRKNKDREDAAPPAPKPAGESAGKSKSKSK